MKRYENLQSNLWDFVKGGCLFFSLLGAYEDRFEKNLDFIDIFQWAISKKKVSLDGTVNDSLAILNHIDGRKWNRIEYSTLLELPLENKGFLIAKWKKPNSEVYHFRPISYDVFLNSNTVRVGSCISYYYYFFE